MKITREDDVAVIRLPVHFAQELRREVNVAAQKEIAQGITHLAVDAAEMEFIDSACIGLLVALRKQLLEKEGWLHIRNLKGMPLQLFRDTALDAIFQLEDGSLTLDKSEIAAADVTDLSMSLKYETKKDIGIFHFSGVLNSHEAVRRFKEQALLAMEDTRRMILNFADVTHFDSALAATEIRNICKLLKTSNGELRLSNTHNLLDDALELVGNEIKVSSYNSLDAALQGW